MCNRVAFRYSVQIARPQAEAIFNTRFEVAITTAHGLHNPELRGPQGKSLLFGKAQNPRIMLRFRDQTTHAPLTQELNEMLRRDVRNKLNCRTGPEGRHHDRIKTERVNI